MTPGQRIKEIRKNTFKTIRKATEKEGSVKITRKSLTQKEFAESLDISSSYVCDLERDRKSPSGKFLRAINKRYSISSDYILYGGKPKIDDKMTFILDIIKNVNPPFTDDDLHLLIMRIEDFKQRKKESKD